MLLNPLNHPKGQHDHLLFHELTSEKTVSENVRENFAHKTLVQFHTNHSFLTSGPVLMVSYHFSHKTRFYSRREEHLPVLLAPALPLAVPFFVLSGINSLAHSFGKEMYIEHRPGSRHPAVHWNCNEE